MSDTKNELAWQKLFDKYNIIEKMNTSGKYEIKSSLILLIIVLSSCNKDDDMQLSNWEVLNTNTTQTLIDIDFSDDNNGIALISIGKCLITSDGGVNWHEKSIKSDENFISCFALNRDEFYVGRNRLFKSSI